MKYFCSALILSLMYSTFAAVQVQAFGTAMTSIQSTRLPFVSPKRFTPSRLEMYTTESNYDNDDNSNINEPNEGNNAYMMQFRKPLVIVNVGGAIKKVGKTFVEVRELEATGKFQPESKNMILKDVAGDKPSVLDKALVQVAATFGRSFGKVFGSADPEHWIN